MEGKRKICLDYDSLCPNCYRKFFPEIKESLKIEENSQLNLFALRYSLIKRMS